MVHRQATKLLAKKKFPLETLKVTDNLKTTNNSMGLIISAISDEKSKLTQFLRTCFFPSVAQKCVQIAYLRK